MVSAVSHSAVLLLTDLQSAFLLSATDLLCSGPATQKVPLRPCLYNPPSSKASKRLDLLAPFQKEPLSASPHLCWFPARMGCRLLYLLFSFSPPLSSLLLSSPPPPPSPLPPLFSLSLPLSSSSLPPSFSAFPPFLSSPVILFLFSLLSLLHLFFSLLPLFSSFFRSPYSLLVSSPSLVLLFLLSPSVLLFLSPPPSLALLFLLFPSVLLFLSLSPFSYNSFFSVKRSG